MKRKRQGVKVPLAQFIAIIALSMSIFLIVDFGRRTAVNYRIQREADRLSQEVEAAQHYQTKLLAQRTYAASDLYVEEVARQELKWAKPGEVVVMVMPTPEAHTPLSTTITTKQINTVSNTPRLAWWQLFFGRDHPSDTVP